MAAKQQQQMMMGSGRFVGLSQDYPLATAASFSSPGKKWVLNSKKDVVEVDGSYNPHQQQHHQHQQQQYLDSNLEAQQQQPNQPSQQGYMGECGRLMRYNSAPSCLFSDLEQIARSLNDAPQMLHLPPLPVADKAAAGKKPAVSGSRLSAQSSVMDFDHESNQGNGFTGLLTGGGSSANCGSSSGGILKPGGGPTNLARQGSSPASLLSRLEIEHATTGSSEDDSPLMRSPINDQDGFWDGAGPGSAAAAPPAANVAAAVAAAQHAHHVAAAIHHHHQQQQQIHHSPVFVNGGGGAASAGDSSRKRIRDVEMDLVEAAAMDHHNQQQHQQQQQQHTLTRHLSLPMPSRSSSSLLAAENLLQDSVPCRLRAKRGCATHPRSIAERVRRTRISERMRRLQELVPNMDKQTNMSDMLDEAAEYMKFLQKKVEELEDCREKCQGLCKMSQSASLNHPSG